MAKRFVDTDKYKKPFMRLLPGAYKLLWDYICVDCNNAGIWQVDFEVAQIYLGKDMPVNDVAALKYFNTGEERIKVLNGGSKWFIIPFIVFQYGQLKKDCKPHISVRRILDEHNLKEYPKGIHTLKDKDMDKDMDKDSALKGETKLSESQLDKAISGPNHGTICELWVNGECHTKVRPCPKKAKFINGNCYLVGERE